MKNKIDYGIDLGTTNSAIARIENGIPVIKKSDTLKDTFPSCISFTKKMDILVGDTAYNAMKNDSARALKTFEKGKTNTFIEFKRTMGTTHSYESSHMNRCFTSEELSSEVLKALKSVVRDENISSVVITVPTKFLSPQNEATVRAAKLAGFKQIELLQEPVAAATAYGLGTKTKDGYWLVFDFGGGTFDAALIKSEEGILSVKDTDGDNWLGGKNLDEAIVDKIIIPYLKENYAISFVLEDPIKRELLRAAVKYYAEEAKNQMSFKDKHNILTQLGDLPFEDENGEEPEVDIWVTQKDMEGVLGPIFQKAVDITKELLKRNNLKGNDIQSLILVGGPTYSPILRRMLKEQITENVDTSVDPMTVVSKGAALFASTLSISDTIKEASRDKTKLQLDIKYEATTVELEVLFNIKVLKEKTFGKVPDKIMAEIVRSDGAWSSGKKFIGEKASLIDLVLTEGRSNAFEINTFDEFGNKIECQPNQFSILQGIGGLDGMQVLPYNIGIAKYFDIEGKDLFHPVKGLEKNKKIPAVGVTNGLKTRSAIRPGMIQDIIRIPIYQGEYNAEGTNPVLNNLIEEVVITGETVPGLLPEGSDVDLTIKVDRSQIMRVSAFFPLLNHTEEVQVEIKSTEPPSEEKLANELLKAMKSAEKIKEAEITANLQVLEKQLENEKGSADGKMRILDNLRKELLRLENATKVAEWPIVEKQLKDSFYNFEDLIEHIKSNGDNEDLNMDRIEAHLAEYRKLIEQLIKSRDIKASKELLDEIIFMSREVANIASQGVLDCKRVQYHDEKFSSLNWKDKNKARQLINQGLQLITEGKTKLLKPIIQQIWDLRIDDDGPKDTLR